MDLHRPLLILAAIAGLTTGGGLAWAHSVKHPTLLDYSSTNFNSSANDWNTRFEAGLDSVEKCIGNRPAKIIGVFDGERRVVDSGRSSRNGHIALAGGGGAAEAQALESLTFKVSRTRFGPSGHAHVCQSFELQYVSN